MRSKIACLLVAAAAPLLAHEFAPDARSTLLAHARLDPATWAQVVVIGNHLPRRDYPAQTWATVFELEDRLWIYLPREGTHSLSHYDGRLESDKADLRDVLARVHGGFTSYEVQTADGASGIWPQEADSAPLPNGCLIDAVTRYQRLRATEQDLLGGLLLMYYGGRLARWGHTVLCFETPEGWFYWDSKGGDRLGALGPDLPGDALRLARMTVDDRLAAHVTDARVLRFGG